MNDDFVKLTLIKWLPGGRRKGGSGWETMNCLMCHLTGEPSRDTKRKAGVIFQGPSFTYHCFRCGFKAHWKPGMLISRKLEQLLQSAGCANIDIQQLKIQALKLSRETEYKYQDFKIDNFKISFDEIKLPYGSKSIIEWANNEPPKKFLEVAKYIIGRNTRSLDNFYWSYELQNQMLNRIIIPFYFDNKIVGYTARFIKEKIPPNITKYHTKGPNGFLFNNQFINDNKRKYILLVEGPFDALAIDGVAFLSNRPTVKQISWLNDSGKEIILIADKNKAGIEAVDVALENNWSVSFPGGDSFTRQEDEDGVIDIDDRVNKYGVIWTVKYILEKRINDSTGIQIKAKLWHR